jgi:hypothetical protein
VTVLEGAEGDSELSSGLGASAFDFSRFPFVDSFTSCLFEAEICRILETQENIVGVC